MILLLYMGITLFPAGILESGKKRERVYTREYPEEKVTDSELLHKKRSGRW
jgi:hypothetical protein